MRFDFHALGRLKTGQMNKMETRYAEHLENQKRMGAILWFKFEGCKLKLADNTHYTPDFVVMDKGGEISFHETKGFFTDKAKVKVKVAAEMYPFVFKVIRWKNKAWEITEF